MKALLLTALALHFIGCSRLAIWMEGVKQPALEDYYSLTEFLLKFEMDTADILCFKDTNALNNFYLKRIGLPESRFFNSDKNLVDYRESPEDCNGMVSVFLEKVEAIKNKPPVPNEYLSDYIRDLVHEQDQRPFVLEQEPYDLYLAVYWAKFLGKVNKRKVFEWLSLVEDARKRGMRIRVFNINADYQTAWKIKKTDLPEFRFK